MIALGILELIRQLALVFSIPFGGIVTELPFGMQPAIDLFAGTLNSVFEVLPFIEVPFALIMWAIGIKIMLIFLQFTMWIIERIR